MITAILIDGVGRRRVYALPEYLPEVRFAVCRPMTRFYGGPDEPVEPLPIEYRTFQRTAVWEEASMAVYRLTPLTTRRI